MPKRRLLFKVEYESSCDALPPRHKGGRIKAILRHPIGAALIVSVLVYFFGWN